MGTVTITSVYTGVCPCLQCAMYELITNGRYHYY